MSLWIFSFIFLDNNNIMCLKIFIVGHLEWERTFLIYHVYGGTSKYFNLMSKVLWTRSKYVTNKTNRSSIEFSSFEQALYSFKHIVVVRALLCLVRAKWLFRNKNLLEIILAFACSSIICARPSIPIQSRMFMESVIYISYWKLCFFLFIHQYWLIY